MHVDSHLEHARCCFAKNAEMKTTLFFHINLRDRICRATVFYIVLNARNAATVQTRDDIFTPILPEALPFILTPLFLLVSPVSRCASSGGGLRPAIQP